MADCRNVQLPPSFLVSVFELLLAPHFTGHSDFDKPTPKYAIRNLLHVCQNWRNAATAAPHLWRNVSLSWSPELISGVVTWSGAEDLALYCTEHPSPSPENPKVVALLEGIHRIDTKFLTRCDDADDGALGRTLSLMTSLHTLDVRSLVPSPFHLPTIRRLRHLHMRGCGVRFDDLASCRVTHLTIDRDSRPNPVMTLEDLHRLPSALAVLRLIASTTISADVDPDNAANWIPVLEIYPHLEHIYLEGDLQTCCTFFRIIGYMTVAQLHLRCRSLSPSDGPLDAASPDHILALIHGISDRFWKPTPLVLDKCELSICQYQTASGYKYHGAPVGSRL
ncbi:hypothetical protein CONPUDRAFT_152757 [Coniophora puteana RWD-64-598 SS2]|uniref:Uncharacterized protein n=1 Tax=Coniophora puteana (strain RWD-64-598) TaxID=741705 RepID=A0A5M3MRS2_CONPW|nr:uncharacterized protein CONPUDRAFT_152757 [Coniophora puteana RWD-64-598 SS2]EIW81853.1 hypothetical protein CONPUDRAFT_152757 [Coniophora puteana RWD-64-598 SS2]